MPKKLVFTPPTPSQICRDIEERLKAAGLQSLSFAVCRDVLSHVAQGYTPQEVLPVVETKEEGRVLEVVTWSNKNPHNNTYHCVVCNLEEYSSRVVVVKSAPRC